TSRYTWVALVGLIVNGDPSNVRQPVSVSDPGDPVQVATVNRYEPPSRLAETESPVPVNRNQTDRPGEYAQLGAASPASRVAAPRSTPLENGVAEMMMASATSSLAGEAAKLSPKPADPGEAHATPSWRWTVSPSATGSSIRSTPTRHPISVRPLMVAPV